MSAPESPVPAPEDAACHLLVVDDDDGIRKLLARYLAREGFLVTSARDAAHARRLLAGLSFDLLIVDVMMPGESGLDFTADIRPTLDAPVLLLTARGGAEDRIKGLEAGADDYLPKPPRPDARRPAAHLAAGRGAL